MVSRTLLVVLVATCCVHSLNAWPWPWDRKTTTTPAPAVMSREKFLARLRSAAETVTAEVAKSHQIVQEADSTDKPGQARAEAEKDLIAYTKKYSDQLNDYAAGVINNTVDAASCIDRFMDDMAEIEAYLAVGCRSYIERNMQLARDIAAKADPVLDTIASVTARGEEEAAKPDGEYGGNVDAILEDAQDAVRTAKSNNDQIVYWVEDLKSAATTTIMLYDSRIDVNAALDYGRLCVRRVSRSLGQQ